jgi:hypothetical protein
MVGVVLSLAGFTSDVRKQMTTTLSQQQVAIGQKP